MKRSEFKIGEFLVGIPIEDDEKQYYKEHPQPVEDFVFIHDGYITGDGYGMLIGIDNGKVVTSSGIGNFQWGGNVRLATESEIEGFMRKIRNQDIIYKY